MSSYKKLTSSPAYNVIGETKWDVKTPSNKWVTFDGSILLQNAYSNIFNTIGYLKNTSASNYFSDKISLNDVNVLLYANNTYIAAGNNGFLATSTNLSSWTTRTTGTNKIIKNLIYANNTFVAVGSNLITTSTDTITWTERVTPQISSLTYVGGKSGSRTTTTYPLTISLTDVTGGISFSGNNIVELIEGDIIFVAVATASTLSRNLSVSGYTQISSLYANDTYDTNLWVGYKVVGSTPETTVTIPGLNTTTEAQTYAIQIWRGLNPNDIFAGTTATTQQTNTVLVDPGTVTTSTSNSVILVIGAGAHVLGATNYTASYLSNFLTATADVATQDSSLGFGFVRQSASGAYNPAAWTIGTDATTYSCASVTIALKNNTNINSVAYGNNTFVAVGDKSYILTSPDGITWTQRAPETVFITANSSNNLNVVTYANNVFIAAGENGFLSTSTNGITWSENLNKPLTYVGGKTAGRLGNTIPEVVSLTNLTGGISSAPAANDVVFVAIGTAGTTNVASTLAANGYTQILASYVNGNSDTNLWVGYRIMESTPNTTITIPPPPSVDNGQTYAIQVWRNCDLNNLFNATPTVTTTIDNTIVPIPNITTTSDYVTALIIGASALDVASPQTFTAPYLSNFISSANPNDVNDVTIGFGSYNCLKAKTYSFDTWGPSDVAGNRSASSIVIPLNNSRKFFDNNINDIINVSNNFIIVGNSGELATSSNGVTWTSRTSGTLYDIKKLAYGSENKEFVYIDHYGNMFNTTNGISWSNFVDINFLPLTYVGGKTAGRSSTSSEVVSLTDLTGGVAAAPAANDVVFVAVSVASTTSRETNVSVSGYTQILFQYVDGALYDTNLWVGYKIMGSTPDSNVTIPGLTSTADTQTYAIQVWRNCDLNNLFDGSFTWLNSITATAQFSPIYSSGLNNQILAIGAGASSQGTQTYSALAPTDYSVFLTSGFNSTNDSTIGFGAINQSVTPFKSNYDANWSFSGSTDPTKDSSIGILISLRSISVCNSLLLSKGLYSAGLKYGGFQAKSFYTYDPFTEFSLPTANSFNRFDVVNALPGSGTLSNMYFKT